MSIQVTCPNGHALKVKAEYAGRTGRCPKCRAVVVVPELREAAVSDDDVLGFIGPAPPPPAPESEHFGASGFLSASSDIHSSESDSGELDARPTQVCPKCNRRVSASYHFCPYCRCYFGEAPMSTKATPAYCRKCGTEPMPGDKVCSLCGTSLT